MDFLLIIFAILIMPIFAFFFIYNFFNVFKHMNDANEKERNTSIIITSIFFSLIIWTFSGLMALRFIY